MTNLTEQWKKGELPAGYYYIEAITGEKIIDFMPYNENEFKLFPSHTSIVICEVPSYDEYQALLSDQLAKNEGAEINAELEERLKKTQKLELDLRRENTKLKELLKECEHIMSVEKDFASCHFEKDKLCKLLTKINQVLDNNQIQANTVACNEIQEKNNGN